MAEPIKLSNNLSDAGKSGSSASNSSSNSTSSVKIDLGAPTGNIALSGNAGNGNSGGMGNIFTQSQAKKDDSKMITSVISQKEIAQKTRSILGPAPTLEKSIEKEKEASAKRKLRLYQFVFLTLFVASGAMVFYFYSQLSPDFSYFGANVTQTLALTNSNLLSAQTKVNVNRYLAAQLKLNEFSYESDRFFSNVQKVNDPTISSSDKQTFFADLSESKQALPVLLGDVRDILGKDVFVQTYTTEGQPDQTDADRLQAAQSDLRKGLSDLKKTYGQNPTSSQDIADVKLIDNASKLVGNNSLLKILQGVSVNDFSKQLDDYATAPTDQKFQTLQTTIGKILSSTKSDLATIANIKQKRVDWATIISQINDVTASVDLNFGKNPSLYDTLGGIVYTGYELDSNSDKIVLSGMTKTFDGSNFTLLSKLIDQMEGSQYFQDVDMRSFSKSKTGDEASAAYVANFKIDLRLQPQSSTPTKSINLQNNANGSSTPVTPRSVSAVSATQQTDTSAATAAAPAPTAPASTASAPSGQVPTNSISTSPTGNSSSPSSAPAVNSASSSSDSTASNPAPSTTNSKPSSH